MQVLFVEHCVKQAILSEIDDLFEAMSKKEQLVVNLKIFTINMA